MRGLKTFMNKLLTTFIWLHRGQFSGKIYYFPMNILYIFKETKPLTVTPRNYEMKIIKSEVVVLIMHGHK